MGKKDIAEKHFEEINKIFADIVNGTLFGGRQTVKEDELFDLPAKSQYKADNGELHEQERDIAKRWSKENVVFSIIGIENQTVIDKDMVLRVIGYDGASYRSQLLEKEWSSRYPVITIVLYYGKEPWNAPRNLKDRLDVPACLDKYVSDYHINVFDVSHMGESEIDQLFCSDFRILAQFMRSTDHPGKLSGTVEFPDPLLKIMTVLTGDHRFEELTGMFPEGGVSMTNVFSKMLDDASSEGISKGVSKGVYEASAEIARKMFLKGFSFDDVETCVSSLSKEDLQKILDEVKKTN